MPNIRYCYQKLSGADPGFWFGSGTGRESGGQKTPSAVQGQSPGGGLGASSRSLKNVTL